jgi:hypothetical protein
MSTHLEEYQGAPELEGQVIYEPDWYLLSVGAEGHTTLLRLLDSLGVAFKPADKPHISIMKDEAPAEIRPIGGCRSSANWSRSATGPSCGVRTACTSGLIAIALGCARCGSTLGWSP